MSTPDDKPKVPASWQTITRVADEANARDAATVDELTNLSDAAIDAELAAAGFDPDEAAKLAGDALAPAAKPEATPEVRTLASAGAGKTSAPARSRWPLFALAAAAVLLGLLVWKRDAVVAFFSPPHDTIGPDHDMVATGPTPEEKEKARLLRIDGVRFCQSSDWAWCAEKLDEAKKLDPAGEDEPDVKAAREQLKRVESFYPPLDAGAIKR